MGRALRLLAVLMAGFGGGVVGVLPYLDLSEGPFVTGQTRFDQVDWDPSDCYWSPEAAEVDSRLAQAVLGVPVVLVVLVGCGFAIAAWRNTGGRSAKAVDLGSADGDLLLACGVIAVASAAAVGTAHGFAIGRLLDPGCVRAGVPGLVLTVLAQVLGIVTAVAVGTWLENRSRGRRAVRTNRFVDRSSESRLA